MKRIVKNLLLLLGAAFVAVSCNPDNKQPDGGGDLESGVIGISHPTVSVGNISRVFKVSFVSFAEWTVESDSDWCVISSETVAGSEGDAAVRLLIEQNPNEDTERTAVITVSVKGFAPQVLCTVVQSKSGGVQTGRSVNRWISNYMLSHYLWNDKYGEVEHKLDYDQDPDKFLNNALSSMRGNDDDGGFYVSGLRYYYTTLAQMLMPQSAPTYSPMAAPGVVNNLGIQFVYPITASESSYYLLVSSVFPDSPAAGKVKRGQYLTSFNGRGITNANLDEVYSYAMGYATVAKATFGVSEYIKQSDNSYKLTDMGDVEIVSYDYVKNPIIYYNASKIGSNNKVVAYMVLAEFDASNKDQELLDLFDKFKGINATDIIVDLRYNGGGDVYSSAVLGTLMVGDAYKGKVYSHMEFNEMRKANGEEEFFYIGQDPSMGKYQPITDALSRSLNVKTAYVLASTFTASASELVINGLRGLGVTVYVVGETTEGKNVGMEVAISASPEFKDYDFGEYLYQFAPITFYNRNAEGFKDYGDGFKPDFECSETVEPNGNASLMFDWEVGVAGNDILYYAAITHLTSGVWPTYSQNAPTRMGGETMRVVKDHKVLQTVRSRNMYVFDNKYYNR